MALFFSVLLASTAHAVDLQNMKKDYENGMAYLDVLDKYEEKEYREEILEKVLKKIDLDLNPIWEARQSPNVAWINAEHRYKPRKSSYNHA
ncbi:MAG TPA: hypothetical protein VI874_03130, partial [Candidatus Norongarragalinales archaeon]|nr:hypothetical protein [Candidatus Norongarragalinales archaeon]